MTNASLTEIPSEAISRLTKLTFFDLVRNAFTAIDLSAFPKFGSPHTQIYLGHNTHLKSLTATDASKVS
jgi:hypothetical protein